MPRDGAEGMQKKTSLWLEISYNGKVEEICGKISADCPGLVPGVGIMN
jgi:hypothetical protein